MRLRMGVTMLLMAAWPAAAVAGGVAETYADVAGRILGAETVQGQSWPLVRHLTDRIGPRLSGSAGAEAAVRWAAERLKADGLEVRTEPVRVPHWVRGEAAAEVVAPAIQTLAVTALGGSDPTPGDGLTAEVVEAASFDELHALGPDKVRGKIVLFNRAMTKDAGYGVVAPLRTRGAVEAARLGAVASLVRSLGTAVMRLPHTGAMDYDPEVTHIPAAAVSAEDADLLHRLLEAGEPVRVHLRLTCQRLADAPSANVVADLPGREAPGQVVLIGAHLDSWDLGTGAIDDGAGVAMVMETLRLLKSLDLRPRRTLRGVLFMNEENGLRGGRGYAERHREELARHVAAIETDGGGARPLGFGATTGPGGIALLQQIASLLHGIGADRVHEGGGGADISPLRAASVPLLGLDTDGTHYFDWHHSAADTLDKLDPQELAQGAAALAVMAYVLADMPEALPHPAPPEPVQP